MRVQAGKRRTMESETAALADPAPVEPGNEAAILVDEGGSQLVLAPAGDAFELWLHVPGRGAVAVSVTPTFVLRLGWWIVWTYWARRTLCGLRTRYALWQARRVQA